MIVRLHKRAEAEVREAAAWYHIQGEALSRRFLAAIRKAFEKLESEPLRFAKLESLPREMPFRRVLLEGFPYLVIFEVFDKDVFVYAVAHASRRPDYWRRRKRPKI